MVERSFADFAERNLSGYPVHLPVACVGGVAAAFGDLLRETLTRCGREVMLPRAKAEKGIKKIVEREEPHE